MPAPTPGYVKNVIRRSLREIVDPSPSKKEEIKIWDFFNSKCAYCDKALRKESKEGHIDHLVPASSGGSNQISNRVLSCAACNEKEKLDMSWEKFLAQKCANKSIGEKRKEKILDWQKMHESSSLSNLILDRIRSLADETAAFYDEKIKEARSLRNGANHGA